jgi:hypothetical protein
LASKGVRIGKKSLSLLDVFRGWNGVVAYAVRQLKTNKNE